MIDIDELKKGKPCSTKHSTPTRLEQTATGH